MKLFFTCNRICNRIPLEFLITKDDLREILLIPMQNIVSHFLVSNAIVQPIIFDMGVVQLNGCFSSLKIQTLKI
jgi:hypothetical protein